MPAAKVQASESAWRVTLAVLPHTLWQAPPDRPPGQFTTGPQRDWQSSVDSGLSTCLVGHCHCLFEAAAAPPCNANAWNTEKQRKEARPALRSVVCAAEAQCRDGFA